MIDIISQIIDRSFTRKMFSKVLSDSNYSCRKAQSRNSNILVILGFSISPSQDLRGSRRPVGATRLPCAISPSTFFFALLLSRPLALSLSILDSRLSTSVPSVHSQRLARTPAIRVSRRRDAYSRPERDRSTE